MHTTGRDAVSWQSLTTAGPACVAATALPSAVRVATLPVQSRLFPQISLDLYREHLSLAAQPLQIAGCNSCGAEKKSL